MQLLFQEENNKCLPWDAPSCQHQKLLLLDEPSMGLAPIFIQEIFDIIQDIQKQGTTVLLIEQNANKALAISDRGYVLETGKNRSIRNRTRTRLIRRSQKSISRWLKTIQWIVLVGRWRLRSNYLIHWIVLVGG